MGTILDLALVLAGFTLIIVLHELGHFVAARWAGVRVLAFAVGFGKALVSYRRGLGWRQGSSEGEVRELAAKGLLSTSVSPTEYRFNMLPFGGYVKMLGQDDANPNATSSEPDSYQRAHPAKKLVILSAGVAMNVLTAMVLFVVVMMFGRSIDPPVLGQIGEGTPAAMATPADHSLPVGLREGDRVVRVNGHPARTFDDVALEAAMAGPGEDVQLVVLREGVAGEIEFRARPSVNPQRGMLDLGIYPASGTSLIDTARGASEQERTLLRAAMDRSGLAGVMPGSTLVEVEGVAVESLGAAQRVVAGLALGSVARATFAGPDGTRTSVSLPVRLTQQSAMVSLGKDRAAEHAHVLGLSGVLMVASAGEETRGYAMGLRPGDVFARLGDAEFPSMSAGIRVIRASAGKDVAVTVLREGKAIELAGVSVASDGTIGFTPGNTFEAMPVLSSLPDGLLMLMGGTPVTLACAASVLPGMRLEAIDHEPVSSLAEGVTLLRAKAQAGAASVSLRMRRFSASAGGWSDTTPIETLACDLTDSTRAQVLGLAPSALPVQFFAPLEETLRTTSPLKAIAIGMAETKRTMLKTYLTFARIAQGTLKVEHLKGPVGIAHVGTLIAGRGIVWLLFFLAVVNINLAVINFLPLPIVDGGQVLMTLYEWIRGRPVPLAIQNAIMLTGMLLIAGLFLFVTFNDIRTLLGI